MVSINAIRPRPPPTCTTAANNVSRGSYPSSCSGASDPNYNISYNAGVIVVNKVMLTIIAPTASGRTVRQPFLPPTYNGFVDGDTVAADLDTPSTCTSAATPSSPLGRTRSPAPGRLGQVCLHLCGRHADRGQGVPHSDRPNRSRASSTPNPTLPPPTAASSAAIHGRAVVTTVVVHVARRSRDQWLVSPLTKRCRWGQGGVGGAGGARPVRAVTVRDTLSTVSVPST